jgi:hypothetical protein
MAKGLRATTKKNNRVKIRARVYAPVDEARTERLSQKLLELASQPRPGKTDMELDPEKGESPPPAQISPIIFVCTNNSAEVSSKHPDTQTAEGLSFRLSCPFPASLGDSEGESEGGEEKQKDAEADGDEMFYHLLGLCTDIGGFGRGGELLMDLDNESFSCL